MCVVSFCHLSVTCPVSCLTFRPTTASARVCADYTGGPAAQPRLRRSADAGAESAEVEARSATCAVGRCLRGRFEPPPGLQYNKRNRIPIARTLRNGSESLYRSATPRVFTCFGGACPKCGEVERNRPSAGPQRCRYVVVTEGAGSEGFPPLIQAVPLFARSGALGPLGFRLG